MSLSKGLVVSGNWEYATGLFSSKLWVLKISGVFLHWWVSWIWLFINKGWNGVFFVQEARCIADARLSALRQSLNSLLSEQTSLMWQGQMPENLRYTLNCTCEKQTIHVHVSTHVDQTPFSVIQLVVRLQYKLFLSYQDNSTQDIQTQALVKLRHLVSTLWTEFLTFNCQWHTCTKTTTTVNYLYNSNCSMW